MRCSIMQPTYLPWAGYFNLARSVDYFVLLDDVQFERRSWQSRNRILMNGNELYLSVGLAKNSQKTLIKDVELDQNNDWWSVHWKSLCAGYSKAPCGRLLLDLLEEHYKGPYFVSLAEFNRSIISEFFKALSIPAKIVIASELGCDGSRSLHLYNIAKKLGCNEYLSPIGSMQYLFDDGFDRYDGMNLLFQNYSPLAYKQFRSDVFLPNLSVVDVIANLGIDGTREYVDGSTFGMFITPNELNNL